MLSSFWFSFAIAIKRMPDGLFLHKVITNRSENATTIPYRSDKQFHAEVMLPNMGVIADYFLQCSWLGYAVELESKYF